MHVPTRRKTYGSRNNERCHKPSFDLSSILLAALVFQILLPISEARLLSAFEMAIGKWEVTIHSRDLEEWFDSILFPPDPKMAISTGPPRPPRMTAGPMKCSLVIDADGTFTLIPPQGNPVAPKSEPLHKDICTESSPHSQRQSARGEWFLRQNPYCVTDRQYDELHLVTYPRVKQIKSIQEQYAFFDIRCKLWGRYGMKSVRKILRLGHGRSMGRLTHGTVLLIRRESRCDLDLRNTRYHIPFWRKRIICGTFRGSPKGENTR